jgi:putative ABC transport system permease protein
MAMTDMTIIRRSLTLRRFSTVITVLTVGIAVALMLVLFSMKDAGQRAFQRGGGNMHLLLSAEPDPTTVVLNNLFYVRQPRQPIPWNRYEELAGKHPFAWAIPVQQGDSYRGFPVVATTEEFFSHFTPQPEMDWKLVRGRYFERDWEIVAGAAAARGAGLNIGDQLVLTCGVHDRNSAVQAHVHKEHAFTVVGILAPTGTSHDRGLFTTLQSSWIIHAQDRLEREHARGHTHDHHDCDHDTATAADVTDRERQVTGIFLRLATRPGSNVSAALQSTFTELRREPGITVAQPRQEISRLFDIVANINQLLVAMAGVVMVSSGIGIMLALYNSMEQRRRQIAVLRVLGASRPRIFSLVLTESALIGVMGVVLGMVLAHLGAMGVAGALRQMLGLVVEPRLDPNWAIGVVGAAIGLACAAGLIPAIMAYRTPVAQNLRPIG